MAAALPIFAAPAGAAVTSSCTGGQYPNRFLAQSGLKVACTTAAADNTNHVDIHDADNAIWHHGAARIVTIGSGTTTTTAATAANSATVHFLGSVISAADVRRPIIGYDAVTKAAVFRAGTFVKSVGPTSTCTTTCTSAVLSQTALVKEQTLSVKIEHTNNRFLVDATCANGVATLNTAAPGFALADVGKGVSGGPFDPGTYISSVASNGALSATLNQAPTADCTNNNNGDATASPVIPPVVGADKIQIGAAYYGNPPTPTPVWNQLDPMTIQLSNTTGGGEGFTCLPGQSHLKLLGTGAGTALGDSGGFPASSIGLPVTVKGSAATKITARTSASDVTLAAACPATKTTVAAGSNGVNVSTFTGTQVLNTAASTGFLSNGLLHVVIGAGSAFLSYTTVTNTTSPAVHRFNGVKLISGSGSLATGQVISVAAASATVGAADASAPANGDPMMTLAADINLNPALVAIQDNCDKQTFEGITIVGGWVNPGAYSANAFTPKVSVGQIVFQTAVVSLNGFVVPKAAGETNGAYSDANPHYTFTFPLLPTSSAACIDKNGTATTADDHPLSATGLAFGVNATTSLKAPIMPIGSGNLADPNVRVLMPETGAFTQTYQQINNVGPAIISTDTTTCTVVSATADPGFGCGDG